MQVVSVEGDTIVADVTIPKQAKAGTWDVVVTNPDGTGDALEDGFAVTAAPKREQR